ncbi:hypothetical protein [Actinomadura sp. 21ATH]|uniref:hypothetical protein n=1 Tax=Actinomadura sp. 21ATH TaxID=1735444 RepID=UPI0035BFA0BE
MEFPSFGVILERLLDHRRSDTGSLSRGAGVSETGLRNVVEGVQPGPGLLRALAPALDLHAADLFVMAGRRVPEDLTPLDGSFYCGQYIGRLVRYARRLPADQRCELRRLVREMPQEERREPYVPKRWYDPREAGIGALIGNMLYTNRNLGSTRAAPVLLELSGRRYVSESTIAMVGKGGLELTPDWLLDVSTMIDMPAGELAAITGVPLPEDSPAEDPAAADAAALLWDVRRLSAEQLWEVCVQAEEMRFALPDGGHDEGPYRVSRNPPRRSRS